MSLSAKYEVARVESPKVESPKNQNGAKDTNCENGRNNRGLFCMSMRDRWLVKEHATSDSDRAA